ncbi:MAG: ribbon-helix-helix domain-containing protein [Pseudomonadota bacterium]|nr:ribbon-helix-helix domain-containing protein [Pseudomonadota bacterium]
METKTARLTVLVDPVKKKAFEQLCASQDVTPSQVVRQLIRDYMEQFGAEYSTRSRNNGKQPSGPIASSSNDTITTSTLHDQKNE